MLHNVLHVYLVVKICSRKLYVEHRKWNDMHCHQSTTHLEETDTSSAPILSPLKVKGARSLLWFSAFARVMAQLHFSVSVRYSAGLIGLTGLFCGYKSHLALNIWGNVCFKMQTVWEKVTEGLPTPITVHGSRKSNRHHSLQIPTWDLRFTHVFLSPHGGAVSLVEQGASSHKTTNVCRNSWDDASFSVDCRSCENLCLQVIHFLVKKKTKLALW